MKAEDLIKRKYPPKILLYGGAGTSKTALFSQAQNAYLMDFDGGMLTCTHDFDKFAPLRKDIEFDIYKEENPRQPSGWLKAKAKLIDIMTKCSKGQWEYDCLVVDSLSGLAEVAQNQIMFQCGKAMGKPEIREWGLIVAEVENAIAIIKSLPCLVLVTAHELPIQTAEGISIMKILAPGTKLPAKIPTWFDEVWYAKTKVRGGNRTSYFVSGRKTSAIEARTRSGMNKDFDHTECGLEGVLKEIGYDR